LARVHPAPEKGGQVFLQVHEPEETWGFRELHQDVDVGADFTHFYVIHT
jgi:hypothetical protein